MLALHRFSAKRAAEEHEAATSKRRNTDDEAVTSTGASSNLFDDRHSERSMRDRSVPASEASRRRASATSSDSIRLSATNSDQRANGIVRSAVSSIHVEDVSSAHRPAAAPPAASSGCAICREQYESLSDDNPAVAEAVDARAGGVKTTARNSKARSAIQQAMSNRYVMIFRAEAILRGVIGDEQLIEIMLQMHRRLIEDRLRERPDIVFTPWTVEMLRTHYNPANRHFFDKIRSTSAELARAERMLTLIESQTMVPDANNPGYLVLDKGAVGSLERWSSHKLKVVRELDKMNREKEEDLAAAVFTLVSSIEKMARDANSMNVLRDPRTAAGTVAVGGDALRSANIGSANAIGSAYDFYAMSGY